LGGGFIAAAALCPLKGWPNPRPGQPAVSRGILCLAGPAAPYRTARGEDAAAFDPARERAGDWGRFVAVLVAVLGGLAVVWVYPPTGYADEFVRAVVRPFPPPPSSPFLAPPCSSPPSSSSSSSPSCPTPSGVLNAMANTKWW